MLIYFLILSQSLHHFHFVCKDCTVLVLFNCTTQSVGHRLCHYCVRQPQTAGLGVSNCISQSGLLKASSRHRQQEIVVGNHKAERGENPLSFLFVGGCQRLPFGSRRLGQFEFLQPEQRQHTLWLYLGEVWKGVGVEWTPNQL